MWLFDLLYVYCEKSRDKAAEKAREFGGSNLGLEAERDHREQGAGVFEEEREEFREEVEDRRGVWEWRCLGTPCGLTPTWERTVALTNRGRPSPTS